MPQNQPDVNGLPSHAPESAPDLSQKTNVYGDNAGGIAMSDDYRDAIRRKYPGKGLAADWGNSRAEAIELFCLQCIGSHAEAAKCPAQRCPLWLYRPGTGSTERDAGIVPTEAEYRTMLDERRSDAQREASAALGERARKERGPFAEEG